MYMLDIALHVGTEHPNLLWIAVPSFLSFLFGMVIGSRTKNIRNWRAQSGTTDKYGE